MSASKEGSPRASMAVVATKLSRYVFEEVTQGSVPFQEILVSGNLQKLWSVLKAKVYHSYLIDLAALPDDAGAIADGLVELKEATGVPLILFASGYRHDNPLVEALQSQGFSQWVMSDELAAMFVQLRECLDGAQNAVSLAEAARRERQRLEETVGPGHRNIGFAGSSPGTGTTTQALQYAMFLLGRGHRVCYIEANNQGHIEKMPSYYNVPFLDKEQGYLQYAGLDMYYKPVLVTPNMRIAYDVCVYDYGALKPETLPQFLSCTARVCVGGSKPWEYGLLRWAISMLEKEQAVYLFPFIDKAEQSHLLGKVSTAGEVLFPEAAANMFQSVPKNKVVYTRLGEKLCLTKSKQNKRRK